MPAPLVELSEGVDERGVFDAGVPVGVGLHDKQGAVIDIGGRAVPALPAAHIVEHNGASLRRCGESLGAVVRGFHRGADRISGAPQAKSFGKLNDEGRATKLPQVDAVAGGDVEKTVLALSLAQAVKELSIGEWRREGAGGEAIAQTHLVVLAAHEDRRGVGEGPRLDRDGARRVDGGAEVIGAARDREPRVGADFAMRGDGFFDSDSVAKQRDARSRVGLSDAGHARHEFVGKPKRLAELAKALAETAVRLLSVRLCFRL